MRCCARSEAGGAAGCLERVVRQDEFRDAGAAMGRWHAERPAQADIDEEERGAVAAEFGECA